MVSVSRRAGLAAHRAGHAGVETFVLASGLPEPSGTQSCGSTTGRSFSGTGTAPCSGSG
jgi:hypothetical protein